MSSSVMTGVTNPHCLQLRWLLPHASKVYSLHIDHHLKQAYYECTSKLKTLAWPFCPNVLTLFVPPLLRQSPTQQALLCLICLRQALLRLLVPLVNPASEQCQLNYFPDLQQTF